MKKRIKSALIGLLFPITIASALAKSDASKLGFSWEVSYGEEGFATSNQFDFRYSDLSLSGSINSVGDSGTYGFSANAKSVGKTFGDFKSKKGNSYFDGTRKKRNDFFYAGVNFQRHSEESDSEYFIGAKLKNLLLSSFKDSEGIEEHKFYAELGKGRTIGLASKFEDGIQSSGAYYSKGDLGAQVNFFGSNLGSNITINNLLKKFDESIVNDSERFNAEVGYGSETKGTAALTYTVGQPKGLLKRFSFGLGYSQVSSRGTIIENRMSLGKNNKNIKIRHETGTNKTDFGLDLRY